MRALLDANVLYPTVVRDILLGVARAGMFDPVWSERLIEEWMRAAQRHGAADRAIAEGEAARMRAAFPRAVVHPRKSVEDRLWLPDIHDIHVLAAAIDGNADLIITQNAKDFPRGILEEEGLDRKDADGFLYDLWLAEPDPVSDAVAQVRAEAERLSGEPWPTRKLLKKARLPRLGKALAN